jgi:hypothetical protein
MLNTKKINVMTNLAITYPAKPKTAPKGSNDTVWNTYFDLVELAVLRFQMKAKDFYLANVAKSAKVNKVPLQAEVIGYLPIRVNGQLSQQATICKSENKLYFVWADLAKALTSNDLEYPVKDIEVFEV